MCPNIKIFDSVTGKYRLGNNDRASLLYYRDSVLAIEIYTFYSHETNGVLDTAYFEIGYYQFADLKTNTEIHFKTFTDTATPIKMFKIKPAYEAKTVWGYYGYGNPIDPHSSAVILADTVMNNTNYKRIRTHSTFKNDKKLDTVYAIHYANCNATHSRFRMEDSLSKKFANGCPIQMQDFFGTQSPTKQRIRYDFIRDHLTPQEHKVFDAWEKYVKDHPIKE
jgi:hypothetical protein